MEEYYNARNEIYEILKKDLVGPVTEDEIIKNELPIKTYSLGILYPQGLKTYTKDEQELVSNTIADVSDEEISENDNEEIKPESADRQSSFGISCNILPNISKIKIKVDYANYSIQEKLEWKRNAKIWEQEVDIQKQKKITIEEGLEIRINSYKIFSDKTKTVTISLINTYKAEETESMRKTCEKSFLQVKMEISSIDESDIFIEKQIKIDTQTDLEIQKFNLLYRNKGNIAVGNGTAVMWNEKGRKTNKIWTEVMPQYIMKQMIPTVIENSKFCNIEFLATQDKEEVISELKKLPNEYDKWLKQQKEDKTLTPNEMEILEKNIKEAEKVSKRIKTTIKLLNDNIQAFKAFQLMNQAMFNQMTKKRKNTTIEWRPFQIAFILLTLDGIIDKENEERNIVDLLWFPTGGGKTEAYLGVLAFTIFLRKIEQTSKGNSEIGTVAIMRYTLRLLTIQQFERAATLICACELLRKQNEQLLGKEEISIGLWVGENTFTYIKDAKEEIEEFIEKKSIYTKNPCLVKVCPWCGSEIKADQYDLTLENRVAIKCGNCEIKEYLPIYMIDEEVYKKRPTLLLSTVDKYARIPWIKESGRIFGIDNENILPPELIIQDELHLIAGPLGTIAGLYETVVDEYCSSKGVKPKIIASTATIRNSSEQIKTLYARESNIFPTQIKDISDSFFAKEGHAQQKATRMYVGTISENITAVTLLVRVYAAIFYATRYLKEKGYSDDIVNSFWTEVGYFNSIRELGGAVVQIRNDVRDRYRYLIRNKFKSIIPEEQMKNYYFDQYIEVTSRNVGKTQVDEILHKLEVNYPEKRAQDYVLATNMISVGIDIDRLNLMIIDGQPKLNSEYIQASSRVGRQTPSIVIDLYSATKSRDKSHYEQFITYHSNIYKYIEATSITPFSNMSREKALHAVLISLVRQFLPQMKNEEDAGKIKLYKKEIENLSEKILKRVQVVSKEEYDETKEQLEKIIEHWNEITDGENLVYSKTKDKNEKMKKLLIRTDEKQDITSGFPTLNSMRNVDTSSNVFIIE